MLLAKTRTKRAGVKRSVRNPYSSRRPPSVKSKAESFLNMLSRQFCQSPYAQFVPTIAHLSPAEFFERYYFANRPVILQGLMKRWKALQQWSPDLFSQRFGKCSIEIVTGRSQDPHYESNFLSHRRTLRMKDYVQMVNGARETNDFYLSARNFFFQHKRFKCLVDDMRCPRGFLKPKTVRKAPHLFFGPKGTVTPLHHDGLNIFFGQILGRKLFKLIPPFDMGKVYVERVSFSGVDLGKVDYREFPLMRGASILEVVVEPGAFLFIPVGWWHWVKALDISISVSLTNFCVKGGPVPWHFWE
jgi:ribosomal protein L16 Arg81 hydroxylase